MFLASIIIAILSVALISYSLQKLFQKSGRGPKPLSKPGGSIYGPYPPQSCSVCDGLDAFGSCSCGVAEKAITSEKLKKAKRYRSIDDD